MCDFRTQKSDINLKKSSSKVLLSLFGDFLFLGVERRSVCVARKSLMIFFLNCAIVCNLLIDSRFFFLKNSI